MAFKGRNTVGPSARTTTADSGPLTLTELGGTLLVFLSVTAVSGTTPTLDVSVQWSHDGTTFYSAQPADAFTQVTAASATVKSFVVKAPFYKVVWTVGGTTPSFTFSVNEYVTS